MYLHSIRGFGGIKENLSDLNVRQIDKTVIGRGPSVAIPQVSVVFDSSQIVKVFYHPRFWTLFKKCQVNMRLDLTSRELGKVLFLCKRKAKSYQPNQHPASTSPLPASNWPGTHCHHARAQTAQLVVCAPFHQHCDQCRCCESL